MKLIDTKSQQTVVEFSEKGIQFSSKAMEWNMKNNGITIPDFLQSEYNHQFVVFLGDPLFQKAFKKIYYDLDMNHDKYQWVA